jgi:hypothetical protein
MFSIKIILDHIWVRYAPMMHCTIAATALVFKIPGNGGADLERAA